MEVAAGSGWARLPPRTALQPAAVASADGCGGGSFPRRAVVRRACNGGRRRLRADRCERQGRGTGLCGPSSIGATVCWARTSSCSSELSASLRVALRSRLLQPW